MNNKDVAASRKPAARGRVEKALRAMRLWWGDLPFAIASAFRAFRGRISSLGLLPVRRSHLAFAHDVAVAAVAFVAALGLRFAS